MNVEFAITRTIRDAATLLDAIAGPAAGDPYIIPEPPGTWLEQTRHAPPRLRVALCTVNLWDGSVDNEVVTATQRIGALLEELGHNVKEAVPRVPAEEYTTATLCLWSVTNATTVDTAERLTGRRANEETLEGLTRARVRWGRTRTAADVVHALTTLNSVRRRLGAFFSAYDILLSPTLPTLPPTLGLYDPTAELPHDWYYTSPVGNLESTTSLFNCGGQPAISLPLQVSSTGIPIGIHLGGRFGAEATLLRLAAQLESALPWNQRKPPTHVSSSD